MAVRSAFQKELERISLQNVRLDRISARFFDLGIPKKGFRDADRYCFEQS